MFNIQIRIYVSDEKNWIHIFKIMFFHLYSLFLFFLQQENRRLLIDNRKLRMENSNLAYRLAHANNMVRIRVSNLKSRLDALEKKLKKKTKLNIYTYTFFINYHYITYFRIYICST